jgi:Tol biopolymer transport system component
MPVLRGTFANTGPTETYDRFTDRHYAPCVPKGRAFAVAVATVALSVGIAQTPAASVGATPLTFDAPAWSPNGKLIALISNRDDPNPFPDVYVMNADGSGLRRVTPGQSECPPTVPCGHATPAWSPNGKRLAFQAFGFLDAIDLDGTHLDRLWNRVGANGGACCPAWSPSGRRIAFTYRANSEGAGGQIWLVNADSTGKRRLVAPPHAPIAFTNPTWSPDGSRVAFTYGIEPHPPKYGSSTGFIGVVRSDGTGAVTKLKAGGDPWQPAWSHDGRRIAFADHLRWIAVLDLRTHLVRRLRRGTVPSWSPNDRRIAFEGPRGGIFVMNADGSHLRQLTPTNF